MLFDSVRPIWIAAALAACVAGCHAGAQPPIVHEDLKLEPSDGRIAGGERFGDSVAASGAMVVAGAPGGDGVVERSGSAYVFHWEGAACVQEYKLLASDGTPRDWFGNSVAASGDVVVVGAYQDDGVAYHSGSAYIFRWDGAAWVQEQKLLASDGAADDEFGWAVAASGNVVVAAAYHDDDLGDASGSAYVFRWDGSRWIQEQKLLASDGVAKDFFGISVAASGDVVVVGATGDDGLVADTGSAYVFRWDGAAWVEEQRLFASDGAVGDAFGRSVAASGDVIVVGAHGDDDLGDRAGSAYVFRWDGSAWIQEQKLLAFDGAALDWFGRSVAASGDVVVVGAFGDYGPGIESGSAHLFRWDGSAWVQEQKLLASAGAGRDVFGGSVAASGDMVVAGAPGGAAFTSGAAYVFTERPSCPTDCHEGQKLLAPDGAAGDGFGRSVAATAGVLVVGASGDDDLGSGAGSAYVFRWDGAAWVQEQKLLASDGERLDGFGRSVAASGDVIAIGASGDGEDSGSAYVFRWDGAAWVEEQKLLASDGAAHDYFGSSVAVTGDAVVVGAWGDDDRGDRSGSAYVFRWDGAAWVQEQKLLASDGAEDDLLSRGGVAASGDVIVVGAHRDDDLGDDSGSAYVFRWDGAAWVEEQKLLASDGAVDDFFGGAVTVGADAIVVSASGDDDLGDESGSAYVFRWDGAAWVEEQKLHASDGDVRDGFGGPLAASGDLLVIGAGGDEDLGFASGSAYVFRWDGAEWVEEQKLLAPDGRPFHEFGSSATVSGDVVVVGASQDDHFGEASGAAYIFSGRPPCPADCDCSGELEFFDFLCFQNLFAAGHPAADCDASGELDFFDFLCFQNDFAAGCP